MKAVMDINQCIRSDIEVNRDDPYSRWQKVSEALLTISPKSAGPHLRRDTLTEQDIVFVLDYAGNGDQLWTTEDYARMQSDAKKFGKTPVDYSLALRTLGELDALPCFDDESAGPSLPE